MLCYVVSLLEGDIATVLQGSALANVVTEVSSVSILVLIVNQIIVWEMDFAWIQLQLLPLLSIATFTGIERTALATVTKASAVNSVRNTTVCFVQVKVSIRIMVAYVFKVSQDSTAKLNVLNSVLDTEPVCLGFAIVIIIFQEQTVV